jgi:hypothetical protein
MPAGASVDADTLLPETRKGTHPKLGVKARISGLVCHLNIIVGWRMVDSTSGRQAGTRQQRQLEYTNMAATTNFLSLPNWQPLSHTGRVTPCYTTPLTCLDKGVAVGE